MKTRQAMKSILLLLLFSTAGYGQIGGLIITTPKPKIPPNPQPIVTQPEWKIVLPSIDPIDTQWTHESGTLAYRLVVKQGSGSVPVVSVANMPEGATFDHSTNTFRWSPNYIQSGLHNVEFTATNNIGSHTEKMPIQVQNVESPYFLATDIETHVRWDENRGNFIHLIRPEIWNAGDRGLWDVSVRIEAADEAQIIAIEEEPVFLTREIGPDLKKEVSTGSFFIEFVPSQVRKTVGYDLIIEGVNTQNEVYTQRIRMETATGPKKNNPFYENSDVLILENQEEFELIYATKAEERADDIHMYPLDILGGDTSLKGHGLGKELDMKYPVLENEESGSISFYDWNEELTTLEGYAFSHTVLGTGRFEGTLENMGGLRGSIILHDEVNGLIKLCPMSAKDIQNGWVDTWVANPNYKYLGLTDLNGDGFSDILWYDSNNRNLVVWKKGWAANNEQILRENIDIKNEVIVAVGDTNMDQTKDIVFFNKQTGFISIGLLQNNGDWFEQPVEVVDSETWKYETFGDFDGDGQVDVLFRNKNDHQHFLIVMLKRGPLAQLHEFNAEVGADWSIRMTMDWDGDGKSDILLERVPENLGEQLDSLDIQILEMNGTEIKSTTNYELPKRFRLGNINADFSW